MEKTINCGECGREFTYKVPENYPDRRKYCGACSEKRKADWEAKSTPEAKAVYDKFAQPTQTAAVTNKTARTTQESIEAQMLTKAAVELLCTTSPDLNLDDVTGGLGYCLDAVYTTFSKAVSLTKSL